MEFITGTKRNGGLAYNGLLEGGRRNQTVQVSGMVHVKQSVGGGLTFLKLRLRDGLLQCVCGGLDLSEVPEEAAVTVTGTLREEPRAPGGVELAAESVEVLSRPAEPMPVPLAKAKLNINQIGRAHV